MAMRNLVVYGTNMGDAADLPITRIGKLALCANDSLQRSLATAGVPTNLDLAAHSAVRWDIHNVRDMAYALTRMHAILTDLLPGHDPTVASLRTRIGLDQFSIGSLTLTEFVSIVFGLFAWSNKVVEEGISRVVFGPTELFRAFPQAQELLGRFLRDRAVTIEELQEKLSSSTRRTQEHFCQDLANQDAFMSGVRVFRQYPLLSLRDGRIVVLDLQFLTDLLTSGVYYSLFNSLPGKRRETFRELWGRVFELYVTNLLRDSYPPLSQLLAVDVVYDDGQIDALLDFGPDVIVFEIKSSLLTEAAKRSGDTAIFFPGRGAQVHSKRKRSSKGRLATGSGNTSYCRRNASDGHPSRAHLSNSDLRRACM
jgi:hypothetical protein